MSVDVIEIDFVFWVNEYVVVVVGYNVGEVVEKCWCVVFKLVEFGVEYWGVDEWFVRVEEYVIGLLVNFEEDIFVFRFGVNCVYFVV